MISRSQGCIFRRTKGEAVVDQATSRDYGRPAPSGNFSLVGASLGGKLLGFLFGQVKDVPTRLHKAGYVSPQSTGSPPLAR
jgi:hypothetical protein